MFCFGKKTNLNFFLKIFVVFETRSPGLRVKNVYLGMGDVGNEKRSLLDRVYCFEETP